MPELAKILTRDDLRNLTNEMIDAMQAHIKGCVDADVTFVPVDPAAQDNAAKDASEANIAWTLGHVIVHCTASSEESAFLGAEMARGVEFHGRSRYETQWETISSIAQCKARLEESRRMRLSSLEMWPDHPHTEIEMEPYAPARGCATATRVSWAALGMMTATLSRLPRLCARPKPRGRKSV